MTRTIVVILTMAFAANEQTRTTKCRPSINSPPIRGL
jgi:hypothetical protein